MVGHDAPNFDPREQKPEMDFNDWLLIGFKNGWCGAPVCYTHDGMPSSEQEDEAWLDGDDACIHIIRLYEDEEQKRGVEANHSPSQWRASNRGLSNS